MVNQFFDYAAVIVLGTGFVALLVVIIRALYLAARRPNGWQRLARALPSIRAVLLTAVALVALIGLAYATVGMGRGRLRLPIWAEMVGSIIFGGWLTLLPIVSFFLMFTKLGAALHRWLRNKPPQLRQFRVGVSSLLLGTTVMAVALATVWAIFPNLDGWLIWVVWMFASLPLTALLVGLRIVLNTLEDRKFASAMAPYREPQGGSIVINPEPAEGGERLSLRHGERRAAELADWTVKPTVSDQKHGTM